MVYNLLEFGDANQKFTLEEILDLVKESNITKNLYDRGMGNYETTYECEIPLKDNQLYINVGKTHLFFPDKSRSLKQGHRPPFNFLALLFPYYIHASIENETHNLIRDHEGIIDHQPFLVETLMKRIPFWKMLLPVDDISKKKRYHLTAAKKLYQHMEKQFLA